MRCGGLSALSRRCAATEGRGPRACQPPSGLVTKLPPTVPKHPMQNLWHAIEPKFLAEGVASVSQDRRRGAGSTPVSTAPLPPPTALGSPVAPPVRASLAVLPCGARALLERGLHHLLVWCPPASAADWAVTRWRIASRDWPPLKATRILTVPKHPMQNLWHAIEPKFFAECVAPVPQDRRRGAGSTPVSTAPLPREVASGGHHYQLWHSEAKNPNTTGHYQLQWQEKRQHYEHYELQWPKKRQQYGNYELQWS
jgi:hypothetical protein